MRIGILKPDHLGDLVLSCPAIAALSRWAEDLTLFCHPSTIPLAGYLFPQLPRKAVLLPHLDKSGRSSVYKGPPRDFSDWVKNSFADLIRVLNQSIDLLVCLRRDHFCEVLLEHLEARCYMVDEDFVDVHIATEQHFLVGCLAGSYDITSSYSLSGKPRVYGRPKAFNRVGLCVAAGYWLNSWPLNNWLELGKRLHGRGSEIVLIGGPSEVARLGVLATALQKALGYQPRQLIGSNDLGTFLDAVRAEVDWIVATDSGTAHMVALVRPVVSLFGGSPWRRFAPLGQFNAILSREYPCSPCIQFARSVVNTCHTQECLSRLLPSNVEECLAAYISGLQIGRGVEVGGVLMAQAPWRFGQADSSTA